VPPYSAGLRSVRPAHALRLREGGAAEIERALFAAAYKDVTDFVTKKLWPRPALAVTRGAWRVPGVPEPRHACELGPGRARQLVVRARGVRPGSAGRVVHDLPGHRGWQARARHPAHDARRPRLRPRARPAAPADLVPGLGVGIALARESGGFAGLDAATWITVVGFVDAPSKACSCSPSPEIHTWQPVDSWFRLVTARRNPNLVLLTAGTAAGRPDLGMAAVAAGRWRASPSTPRVCHGGSGALERAALRGWQEQPVASAVRGLGPGQRALE
jgi:hypothetical protein